MADLSAFPITKKWPATHANGRIQLYLAAHAQWCQGVMEKVAFGRDGIAVHEPHLVSFESNEQMTGVSVVESNNKIPAIIDPDGPSGKAVCFGETGAILIYLAEKTGKFIPSDATHRYETIQWVMWQMGGVGPMFRATRLLPQVCRQGL